MTKGNVPAAVSQARRWAEGRLREAGIEEAPREAVLILSHILGTEPPALSLLGDRRLGGSERTLLETLVRARTRRVPLPYLLGRVGFLDFELCVRPGVFIPRPETEGLAERATEIASGLPRRGRVLDLGTGTGAVAVAVARARPDLEVVAVDVSEKALRCAWENAWRLGVLPRVEFRISDLFSRVPERFHLIVSNPPYIPTPRIPGLPPEVSRHEPREAVDGGADGMDVLRRIIREAPKHLFPKGFLLCEIGEGQGEALVRFAREQVNWLELRVENDLAGAERYLVGRCLKPTI